MVRARTISARRWSSPARSCGWRRFRAWIVPRSGGRSGGGCALRARGDLFSACSAPLSGGAGTAGLVDAVAARGFTGYPRCPAVVAGVLCRRGTGVHFMKVGNRRPSPTPRGKGRIPMIRKRRAVVGTAALSAAVMAVTPAPATAQADGQADGGRAWRVVDTRPHPGGDGLLTVAASGRRNVWVFGGADSEDGPTRPVARRWAGGAWHDVALPDEVVGSIDAADASSARNVWAIADHGDVGPSYALRWDGRAWTVSRTWDRRFTTDVVTTGRRNVWVFGYSRAGVGAGTWHFNGERWRKPDLGDLLPERGSAVSARDI